MYEHKTLSVRFTLTQGAFDNHNTDEITLSNVKAQVIMRACTGIQGFTAEITLRGLSLTLLSMLSSKGQGIYTSSPDTLRIGLYHKDGQIFQGGIVSAWADMNAAPEPALHLYAVAALAARQRAAPPFTHQGAVKLTRMLSAIARAAGMGVDLHDVSGVANNPYYEGSPFEQLIHICFDYRLSAFVDEQNTFHAWVKQRDGLRPHISPAHGLIGYPVFTPRGILFNTVYSPMLSVGRAVYLETALPNATGNYIIFAADHVLTTWSEGGVWQTVCQATKESVTDDNAIYPRGIQQ